MIVKLKDGDYYRVDGLSVKEASLNPGLVYGVQVRKVKGIYTAYSWAKTKLINVNGAAIISN